MIYNEKQLHILDVSEKLFACRGFDGTSIRDIAEAAHVNLAMISYYFGSKEKLMLALFQERSGSTKLKLESLINDEHLSPLEKMCMVIDDYVERAAKKQAFYKIMLHEQILEKNPLIHDMLNELRMQNAELISQLIKQGQKKKVFRKDIDVPLLINTMVGTTMQTFISKEYYIQYHKLQSASEEELHKLLTRKLSAHLKALFKAELSYEA